MKFDRPSWDELFIKIASEVSERSTCLRLKVGAVLVKDNRIISIGYNGSMANSLHCDTHFFKYWRENKVQYKFEEWIESDDFYKVHYEWSSTNEIHAEQNALLYAAKVGISTNDSVLYITHSPCKYCAKTIIAAGIKKIKYLHLYDREQSLDFLINSNIECIKL